MGFNLGFKGLSRYATVQICNNTAVIMTHSISHMPYIRYCCKGISGTNCLQKFAHSEELLHHIYFQDFSLKMQVWLSFKNFPWLPCCHHWRWVF